MVLPDEIGDAAQDADEDDGARVLAWLDSGGDINDGDKDGFTLIHCCAIGIREGAVITDGNVSLARKLITLGADVNICDSCGASDTPLLQVLENAWRGGPWPDMVKLLLDAKANTNLRNQYDETPLKHAIAIDGYVEDPQLDLQTSRSLMALRMLLRAGASLDFEPDDEFPTAEDIILSLIHI